MPTQSRQQTASTSRSTRIDPSLRIEEIEAAFTKAGLQTDYETLVGSLGKAGLAETMTRSWLDLTIRDLLASKDRSRDRARRHGRRRATVPAERAAPPPVAAAGGRARDASSSEGG